MASVIDILLRANTTQAVGGMKKFAGSLDNVVRGLTGFGLSGLTATAAVVGLGNELQKSIQGYSDYATAIGKAAELSGVTAEEMSRLAQAADDVFVSQDKLTTAFGMALKNGFVPTIENLATLSDELLAIQDPAARAEQAAKIFGRGWAEIAPFILQGGDAIREGTAAIAEGLVVTDDAVAANIAYKQSIDEWNDSITALKNTMSADLLPAMTQQMDIVNQDMKMLSEGASLWDVLRHNQIEYALWEQAASSGAQASAERYNALALSYGYAVDESGNLVLATQGVTTTMQNQATVASVVDATWMNYNATMSRISSEMAVLTGEITTAQNDLAMAQQNWQTGAGGQVAGLLEQQGLKGDELIDALAGVDEVMGTGLATQEQFNQRLASITEEFAKTGDIDSFKSALEGVKESFMPLNEQVDLAQTKLDELQAKFDELNGKRISMYIDLIQNGGLPSGGSGAAANEMPSGYTDYIPRASGGPVTAGHGYVVGEEGPETFVPRQDGTIIPTGGAGAPVFNIYQQPGESGEQLANRILGKLSRVSSAAGIRSAGG